MGSHAFGKLRKREDALGNCREHDQNKNAARQPRAVRSVRAGTQRRGRNRAWTMHIDGVGAAHDTSLRAAGGEGNGRALAVLFEANGSFRSSRSTDGTGFCHGFTSKWRVLFSPAVRLLKDSRFLSGGTKGPAVSRAEKAETGLSNRLQNGSPALLKKSWFGLKLTLHMDKPEESVGSAPRW